MEEIQRGKQDKRMLAGSQHTQIPSPKASDDLLAWLPARTKMFFFNQSLNPVNPVKKIFFFIGLLMKPALMNKLTKHQLKPTIKKDLSDFFSGFQRQAIPGRNFLFPISVKRSFAA